MYIYMYRYMYIFMFIPVWLTNVFIYTCLIDSLECDTLYRMVAIRWQKAHGRTCCTFCMICLFFVGCVTDT